jgi:hypothetical protein
LLQLVRIVSQSFFENSGLEFLSLLSVTTFMAAARGAKANTFHLRC